MNRWILNEINNITMKYDTYRTRQCIIFIFDLIILILSFIVSMYFMMKSSYIELSSLKLLIIELCIMIPILIYCRCYSNLWNSGIEKEIICIFVSIFLGFIPQIIIYNIMDFNILSSFYIMNSSMDIVGICGIRVLYRAMRRELLVTRANNNFDIYEKVLIIGAGLAGQMIIRELFENPKLRKYPIGIIDDDSNKFGKRYYNVPVLGNIDNIEKIAEDLDVDEIIFSISKIERKRKCEMIQECNKTKCKVKTIPGIYELIDGKVSIKKIRDVNIEDLLERQVQQLEDNKVEKCIKNKTILITGAGGSIGSELCRQVAALNPSEIILLDIYENNVYDIQQELIRKYNSKINLKVIIASVRDENRINEIFINYKPNIVFHAAAHKHVPLMEESPCEAIKNNVFGTLNVSKSAIKNNVEKFILISTDKAVNPTNIMGASKRCCEMIVQTMNNESDTEFVSVRFGNVLGSNGSVVPLFKKQIEIGGPVTVTHPEITRFFMTIPEAVSLVMQACSMAKGGEIFVLNMGEPVKILDLAKNIINLSGFEANVDVKIEFTGLRPGEKLYEEILMDEEGLRSTENDQIFIGNPVEIDKKVLFKKLDKLKKAIKKEDKYLVMSIMKDLVDTYIVEGNTSLDTIAVTNE